MAQIKIRLLSNRRNQVEMANRHKLIAGENLSTAIRVEYPPEFESHSRGWIFLTSEARSGR